MTDQTDKPAEQPTEKQQQAKEPVSEVKFTSPRVGKARMTAAKAEEMGLDPFVYGKPLKASK